MSQDTTLHMLEVLDHLSEGLYSLCNATREQQLLALEGVVRRVSERASKEDEKIGRLFRSLDAIAAIQKG